MNIMSWFFLILILISGIICALVIYRIVGDAKRSIIQYTGQKLPFFGIVSKAFKLYKENFFKLIVMSGLVSLPIMLLFIILRIPRGFNHLITMHSLIMAVVAVAVADNLLGEEISILRSYRYVLKRVMPLALAVLLTCIITNLARMVINYLGYIFVVWLAFVPQQAVVGQSNGWRALIQSKRLVRGYFWVVAGLLIIVHGLIIGLLSTVMGSIASVLLGDVNPLNILRAFFHTFLGYSNRCPLCKLGLAFDGNSLFRQILNILVVPLSATMMALCYYHLRSEKEGVDIGQRQIAESIRLLHDQKNN